MLKTKSNCPIKEDIFSLTGQFILNQLIGCQSEQYRDLFFAIRLAQFALPLTNQFGNVYLGPFQVLVDDQQGFPFAIELECVQGNSPSFKVQLESVTYEKYYDSYEAMLHDPAVLKGFGFNEKEVKFLSTHPWWVLTSLYVDPYLDKFTDEYQPFGVGYDDWDNMLS